MITTGDHIEMLGANGKPFICTVENIRGDEYDVLILKLNMRYTCRFRDIVMEAYEFYVVSHITDRHPTELDLKMCERLINTAPRLARMRSTNPKFRVRLKSGMDTIEEAKALRILFDPQDEYEERVLGLPDLGDVSIKMHEAPVEFVIDAVNASKPAVEHIITKPCGTAGCSNKSVDGMCGIAGCSKRTFAPVEEQFTDSNSTTHLDLGNYGQETDVLVGKVIDDRLELAAEEEIFTDIEIIE